MRRSRGDAAAFAGRGPVFAGGKRFRIRQMSKTSFRLAGIALVAAALGAVAALVLRPQPEPVPDIAGMLWPDPRPVADFSLVDHDGEPFTRERLEGRWTFLFFGYTHCPDICPDTMARLRNVVHALEEYPGDAEDVQVAFVSVDPERDTREHLKAYVQYFDPEFLGVTGSEEAIDRITRDLGIVYALGAPEDDGSYLVDHSAAVLLLGPQGRFIGVFSAPHDPADIAERFRAMRRVAENA